MSKLSSDWTNVKITKKFLNKSYYNNLYYIAVALINNRMDIVEECLRIDKTNYKYITQDILLNLAKLSQFQVINGYLTLLSVSQLRKIFDIKNDNFLFYYFKLATDEDISNLLEYHEYIPFSYMYNEWYILRIYLTENYQTLKDTTILEKLIEYSKSLLHIYRCEINPIIGGCLIGFNSKVLDLLHDYIDDHDHQMCTPLIAAIIVNNNKLISYLLKHNVDVNYYGKDSALNLAIKLKNNKLISTLLDKGADVNVYNSFKMLPAHTIFIKGFNINDKNKKRIIKETKDLSVQNLNGLSVLHYICFTDKLKEYESILSKKKLKLNVYDIYDKSPVHYCKDIETLTKLTSNERIDRAINGKPINTIMLEPMQPYSIFTGNHYDAMIYYTYFVRQYNLKHRDNEILECCIEDYDNSDIRDIIDIYKNLILKNINFQYSNIVWYDSNNYCYSSNIVEGIKYRSGISFLYVTIINLEFDHANGLIVDHDNKRIIHFEPYGILNDKKLRDFDKHMIKLFKPLNYTYYKPKDFQSQNSFQSLSRDTDKANIQLGDIGGFCLAWTLWFLELYIKNQNVKNLKEFTEDAVNKIIYTKYSFIQYIRSYAHKLSMIKENMLLDMNISHNLIYKANKSSDEIDTIMSKLF